VGVPVEYFGVIVGDRPKEEGLLSADILCFSKGNFRRTGDLGTLDVEDVDAATFSEKVEFKFVLIFVHVIF